MLDDIAKLHKLIKHKTFPGHKGRPGKRGGSLPKNEVSSIIVDVDEYGLSTYTLRSPKWSKSIEIYAAGSSDVFDGKPVREPTDREIRTFVQHIEAIPKAIRRMLKHDQTITLHVAQEADMAYALGTHIVLSPEHLTGSGITGENGAAHSVIQHEFLHTLSEYNMGGGSFFRDWITRTKETGDMFLHASAWSKDPAEDAVMMLTMYDENRKVWIDKLIAASKAEPSWYFTGLTSEKLQSKVEDFVRVAKIHGMEL